MRRFLPFSILTLFLCLAFLPEVDAQKRRSRKRSKQPVHRFNAGAVIGLNFSQIDGDGFTGYDKKGIRGGARGSMYLNKKLSIVVELLFSQKGSRFENFQEQGRRNVRDRVLHLDYMEVPFLLSVKSFDSYEVNHGYVFDIGFSYARLINSRVEERMIPGRVSYNKIAQELNSNEFNAVVGLGYTFGKHFTIGLRSTIQINVAYDNPRVDGATVVDDPGYIPGIFSDPETEVPFLRNYGFALLGTYQIF